jgi:hypothetical protein
VVIGLLLGILGSAYVGIAAHDHTLAAALPSPWLTASLGLGIIAVGWVMGNATPRFAAALALGATPGAAYAAAMLAGDGERQLAYGWSAVPVALACLAFGAGFHAAHSHHRPWSARRRTAPRLPRVRTR